MELHIKFSGYKLENNAWYLYVGGDYEHNDVALDYLRANKLDVHIKEEYKVVQYIDKIIDHSPVVINNLKDAKFRVKMLFTQLEKVLTFDEMKICISPLLEEDATMIEDYCNKFPQLKKFFNELENQTIVNNVNSKITINKEINLYQNKMIERIKADIKLSIVAKRQVISLMENTGIEEGKIKKQNEEINLFSTKDMPIFSSCAELISSFSKLVLYKHEVDGKDHSQRILKKIIKDDVLFSVEVFKNKIEELCNVIDDKKQYENHIVHHTLASQPSSIGVDEMMLLNGKLVLDTVDWALNFDLIEYKKNSLTERFYANFYDNICLLNSYAFLENSVPVFMLFASFFDVKTIYNYINFFILINKYRCF